MTTKTCTKCGEPKSLDEFYIQPKMAGRPTSKCKDCTRKAVAARVVLKLADPIWVLGERKRQREKQAARRRAGRVRPVTPEAKRTYIAVYRKKSPEKARAHRAVSRAIKSGTLIPQPCEVCANPKTDAHHDDYTKPLDVRWLCKTHHGEHHARERDWLLSMCMELDRAAA